jgi:hypothetical protein
MNYDLARELKDAGFPQPNPLDEKNGHFLYGPTIDGGAGGLSTSDIAPFYCPTLEQLIEACGEVGLVFYQDSDGWLVRSTFHDISVEGKSLLEAVARLYIAINKKPV